MYAINKMSDSMNSCERWCDYYNIFLLQLFFLPGYNGVFLEQWLFMGRKTEANHENNDGETDSSKKWTNAKIYICTTMYREVRNYYFFLTETHN